MYIQSSCRATTGESRKLKLEITRRRHPVLPLDTRQKREEMNLDSVGETCERPNGKKQKAYGAELRMASVPLSSSSFFHFKKYMIDRQTERDSFPPVQRERGKGPSARTCAVAIFFPLLETRYKARFLLLRESSFLIVWLFLAAGEVFDQTAAAR